MRTPFEVVTEEARPSEALPSNGTPVTMENVQAKMAELSQEFRDLKQDNFMAAVTRRQQIRGQLRMLQKWVHDHEARVQVTLPKNSFGEGQPYELNGKFYYANVQYPVTASEAQQLLHMASQDRQRYMDLFKQNGVEIDLGHIGDRARNQAIMAEN